MRKKLFFIWITTEILAVLDAVQYPWTFDNDLFGATHLLFIECCFEGFLYRKQGCKAFRSFRLVFDFENTINRF
ncbi:hypothetical protein CAEBREN_31465 [Caenorhabditis brenneri]|uniref:Uncharacterized protein n=1 Tax=Caenorhabditis brenneri TaxID=135651 RepID=G0N9H1_CAEBE|nr:hypothetical protein CAEBREN_31465 [Caenorhabditis brenneri]